MDIEGHEWRLLSEGCDWLHVIETICLEWHDQPGELVAYASRQSIWISCSTALAGTHLAYNSIGKPISRSVAGPVSALSCDPTALRA